MGIIESRQPAANSSSKTGAFGLFCQIEMKIIELELITAKK